MALGRVTMEFFTSGLITTTGFHLEVDPGTDENIEAALNHIETAWSDTIRGYQSNQTRLERIRWNTPWKEISVAVALTGSLSGDICVPNIAVLCKNIPTDGPPGRQYWPGLLENQVDARGIILAGHLTNWNVQTAAFHDEINTGPPWDGVGVFTVVNRPGAIPPSPIIGTQVRPKVGVQNRRLRRS